MSCANGVAAVADSDRDVTRLVGAHNPRTAPRELVEGGRLRVPELVSGAHTDQCVLGIQCRKQAVAYRASATVMPNLEHVDVTEHALVDQRLKHVTLGVTGQYRREPLRRRQDHHAGLVGRRILDRRRGRDHR